MHIAGLSQNPEDYQRKSETLRRAIAFQKNIERVEQYYPELADLMQNCIHYLAEYRSCELQCLQIDKEELALAAVQEVAKCLDQGVEPVSALHSLCGPYLLRNCKCLSTQ